jgi:hypothetical protein
LEGAEIVDPERFALFPLFSSPGWVALNDCKRHVFPSMVAARLIEADAYWEKMYAGHWQRSGIFVKVVPKL